MQHEPGLVDGLVRAKQRRSDEPVEAGGRADRRMESASLGGEEEVVLPFVNDDVRPLELIVHAIRVK